MTTYQTFYRDRAFTVRKYPGSLGYRVYEGEKFLAFFIHLDQAIDLVKKY